MTLCEFAVTRDTFLTASCLHAPCPDNLQVLAEPSKMFFQLWCFCGIDVHAASCIIACMTCPTFPYLFNTNTTNLFTIVSTHLSPSWDSAFPPDLPVSTPHFVNISVCFCGPAALSAALPRSAAVENPHSSHTATRGAIQKCRESQVRSEKPTLS